MEMSANHIGNATIVEGKYNTAITNNYGDNYYQAYESGNSGLLEEKVAFNALHDSEARYPQPNLLPGTREEILRRLCSWCEDPSKSSRVFWVHGAAGVGKSAIAQALSEKYIQSGQLAASFFFSRNDATRDKLEPFIATIAHQFAISSSLGPHITPFINQAISSKSGILTKKWEIQFQTLIGEPCLQVNPKCWSHLPQLVIIDGIDECVRIDSQERLLQMIQAATPTLPLNFLIFSRPEPHISDIFHSESFIPSPFHLSLGNFASTVQKDIEKYLQSEFDHIRKKHRQALSSQPDSWPGDSVIQQLLDRATGQFIYATTVIKYIKTGKTPITPMQRLDIILQARVVRFSSPYPDLDLLYSQILLFCIDEEGKLLQMLRLIVSPFGQYKPPEQWNYFQLHNSSNSFGYTSAWALEQLLEFTPGEASSLLSGLHSILDIPESQTQNVAVLHASFSEFLLDPHRSGKFYVGKKLSNDDWKQLFLACQIRTLSQFCIEAQQWPPSSSHLPMNGIHHIDIGSLNVWQIIKESKIAIADDNKIIEALNVFDPHQYLTTLLSWHYRFQLVHHPQFQKFCVVSKFPFQRPFQKFHIEYSWDWYNILYNQIKMFYHSFLFLKTDESSHSFQKFLKRCESFFQGFYVSFTPDQDRNSIQMTLHICQLFIAEACLTRTGDIDTIFLMQSSLLSSTLHLPPINYPHFLFRIISSHGNNKQSPTVPNGWKVKKINSTQGQLLYKLCQCLFHNNRVNYNTEKIFNIYEIEDWVDKLSQLHQKWCTQDHLGAEGDGGSKKEKGRRL